MPGWECGIDDCGYTVDTPRRLLTHQVQDHDPIHCSICGLVIPDGFFAIYHVVEEHSRAEFARQYDASADAIRVRESVTETIESRVDIPTLCDELGVELTTSHSDNQF